MADVFISYSRKDKTFVQGLHQALAAENRDAWVDWEGIPLTADWWAEIQEGIEAADSFVFIISPDSAASEVCKQEVEHAASHNKRIVPIVYRDVPPEALPQSLTHLNWVFSRESDDFDTAFQALMEIMDTDLEWVKAHTRLTQRAAEWDKQGRSDSYVLRGEDLTAAEQRQTQIDKEPELTELQRQFILASRQSTTRRQRITTAGVTFGLIVAIALAVTALVFFQEARIEADARGTAQAEAQSEADARGTAQAEAQSEADARGTAQAEAQSEAHARGTAQAEAQSEADARGTAQAKAQSEANARGTAQVIAKIAEAEAVESKQELEELVKKLLKSSLKEFINDDADRVGSIGAVRPGPGTSTWDILVEENKMPFAISREYDQGRVLAVGHEGVLREVDLTKEFLEYGFLWLNGSNDDRSVLISTGHCEWAPKWALREWRPNAPELNGFNKKDFDDDPLVQQLKEWKYDVSYITAPIDDDKLRAGTILIIGNAWDSTISDTEIKSVKGFVSEGGGLFAGGLGWAWNTHGNQPGFKCPKGTGLPTYPMNRLVDDFDMEWTTETIKD